MCGIFGCIGHQDLITNTLAGLKVLEYRGYDSAGLAYAGQGHSLKVVKSVGDIDKLRAKIKTPPQTTVCLGHTRWATNGGVCAANSHPHLSADGKIAVVHNGIIENYAQCKALLKQHHITLKTNVDTEVIPNILYLLQQNKHNIHKIHDYLQGQYVFCAYFAGDADTIFLAKKGTLPLHIGKAPDKIFVTSDTLALPFTVTQIITLADQETATISAGQITCYRQGKVVTKPWQPFTQSFCASNKDGFDTFMEKEIHEIPTVIDRIIKHYRHDETQQTALKEFHKLTNHTTCVHVCGCGTSYHAALIIAALLEKHLGLRAKAHISSEFTADTLLDTANLAIVISQSGETADTLACMSILQQNQVPIVALCNVTTSTIATQSQLCFPLLCGPEVAVASTKVFVASVLVGCILCNKFAPADFDTLSQITRDTLASARTLMPLPPQDTHKIFFIGKGLDYFLALESALKVKEVTYTHCEGYPANELKHGPLSLIDPHTLSVVYQSHTANAIAEIRARGGRIIQVPDPAPANPLSFIAKIIPAQIFALDMAKQRGIDPDKPRNLAKSVTVL